MSTGPSRGAAAGTTPRRGRPPLSSYPTAAGISRAANCGPGQDTDSSSDLRKAKAPRLNPGPPRRRGRPPRNAAPIPVSSHPQRTPPIEWMASTPASFAAEGAPSDERPPALVFQCVGCSAAVGDSFSWITAQRTMALIVLGAATDKVALVEPIITSSEPGPCMGSTYSVLQCTQCAQQLGRKYHNAPQAMDALREAFSFHVDALIVYQLGNATQSGHTTISARTRKPEERVAETRSTQTPAEPLSDSDVEKIKTMLMVLGERIMRVEERLDMQPKGAPDLDDSFA
ncbi:hypothetical protein MVES1_001675 [Malassezia vespertilionis]|uniref:Mis18 domain-containing protein n=1 Tax=Malassezia vespertilionis TaxID=2020962 RepID=A0A2N1JDM5_9BASI|nr:uncharacterized protein MVES1_001675 [Malassezia vespertilionis]PKI84660.1 hypothetical protein MVES_001576 [Malassezia vespertilionis]WFD06330.1 hypothetical protein MVES1_001675 [Malassezia vespertilionis]